MGVVVARWRRPCFGVCHMVRDIGKQGEGARELKENNYANTRGEIQESALGE